LQRYTVIPAESLHYSFSDLYDSLILRSLEADKPSKFF
jgi:hypothetical protein